MNTKKHFKSILFVAALVFSGFVFSSSSALAVVGVAVDQSGNFIAGYGTDNQALSTVMGGGGGYGGWAVSNPYGLPSGSILGIASNILFWLLSLFAILGVIGFVISGIFYLISAGDEGTMEKGKDGMKWSIFGVIVGLSGFLIMQAVNALLSGSSTTF